MILGYFLEGNAVRSVWFQPPHQEEQMGNKSFYPFTGGRKKRLRFPSMTIESGGRIGLDIANNLGDVRVYGVMKGHHSTHVEHFVYIKEAHKGMIERMPAIDAN